MVGGRHPLKLDGSVGVACNFVQMNQDTARAVARSFQDSRHSWVHIISLHVVLSFKMN